MVSEVDDMLTSESLDEHIELQGDATASSCTVMVGISKYFDGWRGSSDMEGIGTLSIVGESEASDSLFSDLSERFNS